MIIEYKTSNKTSTGAQILTAINYVQKFIENIYEKMDEMTFARYPLDKVKMGIMLEFINDTPGIMIEINNDDMKCKEQY